MNIRGIIGAALGILLVGGAIYGAVWLLPETVLPARYVATDCRRVDLVGPAGPILGAEDIVLSADGKMLYVSAYDRLAYEAAIETGEVPPEGGIYAIPVSHLDRIGTVDARYAIDPLRIPGGVRPHGIDLRRGRMVVVNRGFTRQGNAFTELLVLAETPGSTTGELSFTRRIRHSALCAANDVALARRSVHITLDRGTCPEWSAGERLGVTFAGSLIRMPIDTEAAPDVLAERLAFPNGVVILESGPVRGAVVAETRRRRLIFADADTWEELPLPGGPDNISIDEEGMLVVAVHPNLTKLALYRYGYTSQAATRILRINPVNGEIEVLFDDPSGDVFSAATSAVLTGRTLVAGSVRDHGLLICRYGLG